MCVSGGYAKIYVGGGFYVLPEDIREYIWEEGFVFCRRISEDKFGRGVVCFAGGSEDIFRRRVLCLAGGYPRIYLGGGFYVLLEDTRGYIWEEGFLFFRSILDTRYGWRVMCCR